MGENHRKLALIIIFENDLRYRYKKLCVFFKNLNSNIKIKMLIII